MPSASDKQHNAMEAAAHGASTLGIPKKVGKDFAQADKGKPFSPAKEKAKATALKKPKAPKLPPGMDGMDGEQGAM